MIRLYNIYIYISTVTELHVVSMGITKFKDVFTPHGEIKLEELEGKTIAIDAMCEIHRGLKGTPEITTLTDRNGNPTNYIQTIIAVVRNFHRLGIKQVWIFDNPTPNPHKLDELAGRQRRREEAAEKSRLAGSVPY